MDEYILEEEELEAALRLAHVWSFTAVKLVAINHIESLVLPSARIVQLAMLYDIFHWMTPAIEDLVHRAEPLTVKEIQKLGFEVTADICARREARIWFEGKETLPLKTCSLDSEVLPVRPRCDEAVPVPVLERCIEGVNDTIVAIEGIKAESDKLCNGYVTSLLCTNHAQSYF